MLNVALDRVRKRLRDKRLRAENAYINAKLTKTTRNCKHCGPKLSDQLWGCNLLAVGENGLDASMCHDRKASYCPMFEPPKSKEDYRLEFQHLPEKELALRWPALGELIRIEQLLDSLREQDND